LIFELRDVLEVRQAALGGTLLYVVSREDDVIAQSAHLEHAALTRGAHPTLRQGISYRDEPDPRQRNGDSRLRVAELALGPYRVEIARSLDSFTAIYAATRASLLAILAGVSAAGVIGAYWITRRALSPVRKLAAEAQRLRALSEGSLNRSGRGDEIDDLAVVLNGLLDRTRADVGRIQQFTADAAHEIRTPLAAIRGHLELLLEKVDPASQTTITAVLEEVERLSRLVGQLLLLEKLEDATETSAHVPVDLAALAEELVDHLRVLAADQDVTLEGTFAPTRVQGDAEKLRQVVLNLLDNALRFTPPHGRIHVEVDSQKGTARLVVRDTGPGVSPEDTERIFERFASDRSRQGAGTGLGLAIARAIARSHGGDLRVTPGPGAAFTCELPAMG
jgi:signal transduction histidine kinase